MFLWIVGSLSFWIRRWFHGPTVHGKGKGKASHLHFNFNAFSNYFIASAGSAQNICFDLSLRFLRTAVVLFSIVIQNGG